MSRAIPLCWVESCCGVGVLVVDVFPAYRAVRLEVAGGDVLSASSFRFQAHQSPVRELQFQGLILLCPHGGFLQAAYACARGRLFRCTLH